MIRDEKKTEGGESPQNEVAEYGYYSKVLNKPFDSVEELRKAEESHLKAEEERKRTSAAKKADAAKVEEAWKNLNAAKREYNEKVLAAKRECAKAIAERQRDYREYVQEQDASLDEIREAYDDALAEFNKSHPEGYHVTLKDGDTVKTISRSSIGTFDWFDQVFDSFFGNF